ARQANISRWPYRHFGRPNRDRGPGKPLARAEVGAENGPRSSSGSSAAQPCSGLFTSPCGPRPSRQEARTLMSLQLLLAAIAIAVPTADAGKDVPGEVERAVQAIQTAFNKGDVVTLKGLMTRDHVTILTYAQFANAADQLKGLSDWQFTEYKID